MPPIEILGRQLEITAEIRHSVEHALSLMDPALALKPIQIVLTAARRRFKAEIHIEFKAHKLASAGEGGDLASALADAIARVERQAHKLKARMVADQRRPRPAHRPRSSDKKQAAVEPGQRPQPMVAVGASGLQTVPVVVHDFPARVKITETHVVRSDHAIANKKMSLEEAVKEMEFKDRDVYVFRDAAGKINVLYRSRDGKLELIEVP